MNYSNIEYNFFCNNVCKIQVWQNILQKNAKQIPTIEGRIGETHNLLKIAKSSSGLDMTMDRQVHWSNVSYRQFLSGQGRWEAHGKLAIATSQIGPGRKRQRLDKQLMTDVDGTKLWQCHINGASSSVT